MDARPSDSESSAPLGGGAARRAGSKVIRSLSPSQDDHATSGNHPAPSGGTPVRRGAHQVIQVYGPLESERPLRSIRGSFRKRPGHCSPNGGRGFRERGGAGAQPASECQRSRRCSNLQLRILRCAASRSWRRASASHSFAIAASIAEVRGQAAANSAFLALSRASARS